MLADPIWRIPWLQCVSTAHVSTQDSFSLNWCWMCDPPWSLEVEANTELLSRSCISDLSSSLSLASWFSFSWRGKERRDRKRKMKDSSNNKIFFSIYFVWLAGILYIRTVITTTVQITNSPQNPEGTIFFLKFLILWCSETLIKGQTKLAHCTPLLSMLHSAVLFTQSKSEASGAPA